MSILHPQECYLIEQILSLESYKKRYLEYKAAIEVAEARYQEVMQQVPSDFRSRPVNQQLDLTWGDVVLPNLRSTLKRLEADYIFRSNDDIRAYFSGGLVRSDAKGMFCDMGADFSWMGKEAEQQFDAHFSSASRIDSNIERTTRNNWVEGNLTWRFKKDNKSRNFGLTLPARIPRYELVPDEVVEIGGKVKVNGLYLPRIEHAAANFLNINGSNSAIQGITLNRNVYKNGSKISYFWKEKKIVSTDWFLIRRVEGEYLDVPPEGFFPNHHPEELYNWPEREEQYLSHQYSTRVVAWSGESCLHSGRWSTLMYRGVEFAQLEQGQTMPAWVDQYGAPQKTKWILAD